jgi:hypothetical protein
MRYDARLASPELLALAGLRLKQRQPASRVNYITWAEHTTDESQQPPGITLPVKLSEEEWTATMRVAFGYQMDTAGDASPGLEER